MAKEEIITTTVQNFLIFLELNIINYLVTV